MERGKGESTPLSPFNLSWCQYNITHVYVSFYVYMMHDGNMLPYCHFCLNGEQTDARYNTEANGAKAVESQEES